MGIYQQVSYIHYVLCTIAICCLQVLYKVFILYEMYFCLDHLALKVYVWQVACL